MTAVSDPASDAIGAGFARYIDFFNTIGPDRLDALDGLVTEDVQFRDPFNDVRGRAVMKAIFVAMYRDCTDIGFTVDGAVRQGDRAFLTWTFRFRPRRFGGRTPWIVTGASELHFAVDGRVAAHIDHWDAGAQFYARLPLLGPLIRLVRRRLQHG